MSLRGRKINREKCFEFEVVYSKEADIGQI